MTALWQSWKPQPANGAGRCALAANSMMWGSAWCVVLDAQQQVHVAGYYQSTTLELLPFTLPGTRLASGLCFLTRLAPEPRVQITGDSLLCGTSTQLVATAPAPVMTYRWSTGATTPTITVTQPGMYTVTVTFANGLTSTAQFRVASFAPTVQISGDSLLCPNAAALLTAVVPKPGAFTSGVQVLQALLFPLPKLAPTPSPCGPHCSLFVAAQGRFHWHVATRNAVRPVHPASHYSLPYSLYQPPHHVPKLSTHSQYYSP